MTMTMTMTMQEKQDTNSVLMTCSAPQNNCLKYSFVKDIKVVVEKMTKNCCKGSE